MDPLYAQIRERALAIASLYPAPEFYTVHARPCALSRAFFDSDPLVLGLRDHVSAIVDNDLGHGMGHLVKVTLDAGALALIEGERAGYTSEGLLRRLLLAQIAGLLHDMRRKERHHAQRGAEAARELLADYPLRPDEVGDICQAIRNHEAFLEPEPVNTPGGALISDCLYDADKFRWGPDNFTDTVWHMASFFHAPLSLFLERYPLGMESLARIQTTFRTPTGKLHGPAFILLGIAIGNEIRGVIEREFAAGQPLSPHPPQTPRSA
jgi:hypothetical protein